MSFQGEKGETSNEEEKSENMYSYRKSNQNNQESGAIRRSLGDENPNDQFNDDEQTNSSPNNLFFVQYIVLASLEIAIILALSLLMEYEFKFRDIAKEPKNVVQTVPTTIPVTSPDTIEVPEYKTGSNNDIYFNYGQLRDMSIIAFIGYGLLHSILKKNAWTSISVNTLIVAISVQYSLFFNFVWKKGFKEKWNDEFLDFLYINKAIFISCAVVITYGCVLGKLSIIQNLIMAVLETILATMNFQLCQEKLETIDTGGALYIHTFGAVFALSISVVLFCSSKSKSEISYYESEEYPYNYPSYFSSITSFLGILFLFVYFPSFNSVLSEEMHNINRAKINTYFSLFGAVMGSIVTSGLLNQGRILLEQLLYGTLSGGIIISGCCSVCFYQWAALIIGTLSAAIAVVLLSKIKPIFVEYGLRDTCNVIIIHGIFGILGGFISPMFIRGLKEDDIKNLDLFQDTGRTRAKQSGIQVGALFITIGISFIGGIATGFLMKVSTCGKLNWMFSDEEYFDIKGYEHPRIGIKKEKEKEEIGYQPSYI